MLGPVAAPDAFELVATSEGATAVWIAPGACETSLHVQRFDGDGNKIGESTRSGIEACGSDVAFAARAHIVEISAAVGAGRLGLAWIAQDANSAAVFGSYGSDDATTLAPAARLSAAPLVHGATRGRLQMSGASTGQVRVAYRAPEAACVGEAGRCAQLVTQSLPSGALRVADTREIATPCPRMLVGATVLAGTWYDGFCAVSGGASKSEPLTQVYAIRPEISYAEAVPVLAGCEPLGVSPTSKGVAVWGLCGGTLRAHVVAAMGHELVLDAVTREAKCQQDRPVLSIVAGDGTRLDSPQDEPRDRLELLLPPELAGPAARAAFAGRNIFVTEVKQGSLVLRVLGCRGDSLVESLALL